MFNLIFTDIVKSWDGPQRGIVVRAINDGVGGSVARFYSRESSNPLGSWGNCWG